MRNTIFLAIRITLKCRLLTHRSIFVGRIYGRPLSETKEKKIEEIETDFCSAAAYVIPVQFRRNRCLLDHSSHCFPHSSLHICSVMRDRFHKTCCNKRDSSFQFGYFTDVTQHFHTLTKQQQIDHSW